jgi:hypothetical protein
MELYLHNLSSRCRAQAKGKLLFTTASIIGHETGLEGKLQEEQEQGNVCSTQLTCLLSIQWPLQLYPLLSCSRQLYHPDENKTVHVLHFYTTNSMWFQKQCYNFYTTCTNRVHNLNLTHIRATLNHWFALQLALFVCQI